MGRYGISWGRHQEEIESLVLRAAGPAFDEARAEGSLMSIPEAAGLVAVG